ncbi:hypothetical protein C8J57DRAFT_1512762 [Mycena rebaudengoi]|nr:hypothetical protein C8J57DRAFT_1512762 [Mycena rebaudengoi]
MNVLFLGLLSTLTLTIVTMAELTNHTLDDFDPTVLYLSGAAEGYKSTLESFFDTSSLVQRTQTMVIRPNDNIDPPGSMTFNFTGSALYVFFASPGFFEVSDFNALPAQQWEFSLDGISVPGVTALRTPISLYNLLVYANPGIRAGYHTFRAQTVAEGWFHFDYAIYTSGDGPDSRPSLSGDGINPEPSQTGDEINPGPSQTGNGINPGPSQTGDGIDPEPNAKGHVSISTPAIVGIAMQKQKPQEYLTLCRRKNTGAAHDTFSGANASASYRKESFDGASEEVMAIHQHQPDIGNFVSLPGQPLGTMYGYVQPLVQQHEDLSTAGWPSMVANPPASIPEAGSSSQAGSNPFALTSEGSSHPQHAWNPSTSPSETISNSQRRLSTMKREQMHAIQVLERNYGRANVLADTERGLQLTPGIGELPPYAENR